MHGLRILQGYVECDASPGGVADEDSLLESKGMHQLHGKLCLLRRVVRVVAMSVGLHGALGQPETQAVIGDDCPELCESRSDAVPRERAGREPVQEHNKGFSVPIDLVMKSNTAHGNGLAVLVGEFVEGLALVGVRRDEKRPERQQGEQDSERKR
jgi:hypothetical protein